MPGRLKFGQNSQVTSSLPSGFQNILPPTKAPSLLVGGKKLLSTQRDPFSIKTAAGQKRKHCAYERPETVEDRAAARLKELEKLPGGLKPKPGHSPKGILADRLREGIDILRKWSPTRLQKAKTGALSTAQQSLLRTRDGRIGKTHGALARATKYDRLERATIGQIDFKSHEFWWGHEPVLTNGDICEICGASTRTQLLVIPQEVPAPDSETEQPSHSDQTSPPRKILTPKARLPRLPLEAADLFPELSIDYQPRLTPVEPEATVIRKIGGFLWGNWKYWSQRWIKPLFGWLVPREAAERSYERQIWAISTSQSGKKRRAVAAEDVHVTMPPRPNAETTAMPGNFPEDSFIDQPTKSQQKSSAVDSLKTPPNSRPGSSGSDSSSHAKQAQNDSPTCEAQSQEAKDLALSLQHKVRLTPEDEAPHEEQQQHQTSLDNEPQLDPEERQEALYNQIEGKMKRLGMRNLPNVRAWTAADRETWDRERAKGPYSGFDDVYQHPPTEDDKPRRRTSSSKARKQDAYDELIARARRAQIEVGRPSRERQAKIEERERMEREQVEAYYERRFQESRMLKNALATQQAKRDAHEAILKETEAFKKQIEQENIEKQREKEQQRAKAKYQAEQEARRAREAAKQAEVEAAQKTKIIQELTPAWEDKVQEILDNRNDHHVVCTSLDGSDLTRRTFAKILPQQSQSAWLDDESVNAMFAAIVSRNREQTGFKNGLNEVPEMARFNSAWYTNIKNKGPQGVKNWARRQKVAGVKLLQAKKVFFPINTGAHWVLLIMQPQDRRIELLDSMNGKGDGIFKLARAWLEMELGDKYIAEEWTEHDRLSSQQDNFDDCGVFVCFNGLACAKDQPYANIKAKDMQAARKMLAALLINEGFKGDFEL